MIAHKKGGGQDGLSAAFYKGQEKIGIETWEDRNKEKCGGGRKLMAVALAACLMVFCVSAYMVVSQLVQEKGTRTPFLSGAMCFAITSMATLAR